MVSISPEAVDALIYSHPGQKGVVSKNLSRSSLAGRILPQRVATALLLVR